MDGFLKFKIGKVLAETSHYTVFCADFSGFRGQYVLKVYNAKSKNDPDDPICVKYDNSLACYEYSIYKKLSKVMSKQGTSCMFTIHQVTRDSPLYGKQCLVLKSFRYSLESYVDKFGPISDPNLVTFTKSLLRMTYNLIKNVGVVPMNVCPNNILVDSENMDIFLKEFVTSLKISRINQAVRKRRMLKKSMCYCDNCDSMCDCKNCNVDCMWKNVIKKYRSGVSLFREPLKCDPDYLAMKNVLFKHWGMIKTRAPERFVLGQFNEKMTVFSCGVVLYYAITGGKVLMDELYVLYSGYSGCSFVNHVEVVPKLGKYLESVLVRDIGFEINNCNLLIELLMGMLQWFPSDRFTIDECMVHNYTNKHFR
jgi:serine/threonine protein kinase